MNPKQQKVLIGALVAIVAALLFPPHHFTYPNRVTLNLGYGFIFDPPVALLGEVFRDGSITIEVLLIEWAAIALVAGVLWWMTATTKDDRPTA